MREGNRERISQLAGNDNIINEKSKRRRLIGYSIPARKPC
jgi:hypothetical protein